MYFSLIPNVQYDTKPISYPFSESDFIVAKKTGTTDVSGGDAIKHLNKSDNNPFLDIEENKKMIEMSIKTKNTQSFNIVLFLLITCFFINILYIFSMFFCFKHNFYIIFCNHEFR